MSTAWAARLKLEDATALGAVRLEPGLSVALVKATETTAGAAWLRGTDWSKEIEATVRRLPLTGLYQLLDDGQLIATGTRVPRGQLPKAQWMSLSAWLKLTVQPALMAGNEPPPGVALRLVPAAEFHDANVLVTTGAVWRQYAIAAPAIRLRPLSFALHQDGRCVLLGQPLPPLPGERFVLDQAARVAVPAGFAWSPAVLGLVLKQRLRLHDHDLALMTNSEAGLSIELVRAESFVRATRSAVRASVSASGEPADA